MEKRTESLSDNQVQAETPLRLLVHNVPEFYYYTKYGQQRAKTLGEELYKMMYQWQENLKKKMTEDITTNARANFLPMRWRNNNEDKKVRR